jgi:hypothetical protein
MSVRSDIKTILAENDISITKLAKMLSEKTGKNYSQSNISQKLMRNTLKYEEAKAIGELLGYELKFIRTKSYNYFS